MLCWLVLKSCQTSFKSFRFSSYIDKIQISEHIRFRHPVNLINKCVFVGRRRQPQFETRLSVHFSICVPSRLRSHAWDTHRHIYCLRQTKNITYSHSLRQSNWNNFQCIYVNSLYTKERQNTDWQTSELKNTEARRRGRVRAYLRIDVISSWKNLVTELNWPELIGYIGTQQTMHIESAETLRID